MNIYIDFAKGKIGKVTPAPIYFGDNNVDKITLYFKNIADGVEWYPTLSALCSDNNSIYPRLFDTDGTGTRTIDGVDYTYYEFTLSNSNGWNLTPGRTLFYVWVNYPNTNGNKCVGTFGCTIMATSGYYQIDNPVVNPELREWLENSFEQYYNEVDEKFDEFKETVNEEIDTFESSVTDNFDELSEQIGATLEQQTETIESLGQLQPSGTTTSTNLPTSNQGILVATDNGHWYYWDATDSEYKDGGVYQATQIQDDGVDYSKLGLYNTTKANNLFLTTNLKNGTYTFSVSNSTSNIFALYPSLSNAYRFKTGIYFVLMKVTITNATAMSAGGGQIVLQQNDNPRYYSNNALSNVGKEISMSSGNQTTVICGLVNVTSEKVLVPSLYFTNMGTSSKSFDISFDDVVIVKTSLNSISTDTDEVKKLYNLYTNWGNQISYLTDFVLPNENEIPNDSIDYSKLDLYNATKYENLAQTTRLSGEKGLSFNVSSSANVHVLYPNIGTYGISLESGVYFVLLKYSISNFSGTVSDNGAGILCLRNKGVINASANVINFSNNPTNAICSTFINVSNNSNSMVLSIYFANMGTSARSFTITFDDIILIKTNLTSINDSNDNTINGIYNQYLLYGNQDYFLTEFATEQDLYNPFKNKNLMTLGDSLTETHSSIEWVRRLKLKLGFANVTNLAIGGTKINVFADNVNAENIANVDYLTIMGYFNSATNSPGTVDDVASNDANASICANYKYLIDKILTLKPTIKLIIIVPHSVPMGFNQGVNCEAIRNIANYYRLPVIDIAKYGCFNSYTYSTYLRDGIHSSSDGYEREAELIAGGFKTYFG